MKICYVLALPLLLALAHASDALLKDDFTNPKLAQRRAMRGEWKFADGAASCTQDDGLFKKFKDHGPILFYDLAHTDATVRFSFKADGAKTVVFTGNGTDGHVFRFVMSGSGMSVRAFPPDSKNHASLAVGQEKVALKSGEWVPVVVTLSGSKATVKIGADFEKTYEHASYARPKTNLSIGFSYGTVSVRDVTVTREARAALR